MELKKKQVGGAEMGSQVERTGGKVVAGGPDEAVACTLGGPTVMCR